MKELTAPLQNSIQIGETSKGLYLKSIKLYFGPDRKDASEVLAQLFEMYDGAKDAIKERRA